MEIPNSNTRHIDEDSLLCLAYLGREASMMFENDDYDGGINWYRSVRHVICGLWALGRNHTHIQDC